MTVHAIVLAAGRGTRMNSDTAKVLHRAADRSLISWVLDAIGNVTNVTVVVGHQADDVSATLPSHVSAVLQEPQLGTGHAVEVGIAELALASGDVVLVVPGDMPLIAAATIHELLEAHTRSGAAATVLTATVDDPSGYGRIVRGPDGVQAIVEHRDAEPAELAITEINTSVYAFNGVRLVAALPRIGTENQQGERYLTDVIGVLVGDGERVEAVAVPAAEASGVNSHVELALAAKALRARITATWMEAGVSMHDPDRVYVGGRVTIAPGVDLYPDVHLEGSTSVGPDSVIGPGVFAVDTVVGERTRISYSVLTNVMVGDDTVVGPYAHLRPGTVMGDASKAGSFVEVKASTVGAGSKLPHLAYVGDATIGEGTNIGAGTVTVNYDGHSKHQTVIGDRVRIGSDTMLVAPIEIGDDAYTGAGSVITKDVPRGALAVERSSQRQIPGYAARRQRKADEEQA